ncbi:hypothetical protein CF319_g9578 [Tilletia indica]|nr:hypothetical protein CF319_g9578 [Tilletia indica]
MGEGLKGLGYCTGGASDNIGCSTGPRSPESVQSVLSDGRDRCSSPPWLLESTDVEDYHQARAYAKDLSRDEDGLDFFSQMRASMRSVIAASGTDVDPGPFMALINQAGITKVEVSRMWNEQVDKTEAAEASVKQFQATKDRLEVELASEKSKGAELTCRVLELKAILRERNSQLAQKHVASLGQVGTPCRCGNGGGEAAFDLLTPSPSTSQFQSRRYGTVVVRRALNSSPATSLPFSPTFPRK